MSIVLPILGLLSRANSHLQQCIALVIPHLRNPNIRYDIGFSVGAFTKNKCMFCYPILGLLSGVMPHLQLLALVIPYTGNTKVRCDPGFSLDTFYINKCNFCYPFLPLLGVLSGVKANITLLPLVIPNSGTLRYAMILALAVVLHKYMSILLPLFITPFWVAVRGKAKLKILALISQYRRSLMYTMSVILTLVLLHE